MNDEYLGVADTYIKSARRRRLTFFLWSLVTAVAIAGMSGFSWWQVSESNHRFAAMQYQIESQLDSMRVFQGQIGQFYGQLEHAMARLDSAQWRLEQISNSDLQTLQDMVVNQQALLQGVRDTATLARSKAYQSLDRLSQHSTRIDSALGTITELAARLGAVQDSIGQLDRLSSQLRRMQPRFEEQQMGARQMRETILSLNQRIADLEKQQSMLATDSIR